MAASRPNSCLKPISPSRNARPLNSFPITPQCAECIVALANTEIFPETTAGILLAFILGFGIRSANSALIEKNDDQSTALTHETEQGIRGLWRTLAAKRKYFSGPISTEQSAEAILVGAPALYGMERLDEAKELISQLKSQDVFSEALVDLVKLHFRLEDYELPG